MATRQICTNSVTSSPHRLCFSRMRDTHLVTSNVNRQSSRKSKLIRYLRRSISQSYGQKQRWLLICAMPHRRPSQLHQQSVVYLKSKSRHRLKRKKRFKKKKPFSLSSKPTPSEPRLDKPRSSLAAYWSCRGFLCSLFGHSMYFFFRPVSFNCATGKETNQPSVRLVGARISTSTESNMHASLAKIAHLEGNRASTPATKQGQLPQTPKCDHTGGFLLTEGNPTPNACLLTLRNGISRFFPSIGIKLCLAKGKTVCLRCTTRSPSSSQRAFEVPEKVIHATCWNTRGCSSTPWSAGSFAAQHSALGPAGQHALSGLSPPAAR